MSKSWCRGCVAFGVLALLLCSPVFAQSADEADAKAIAEKLEKLKAAVEELRAKDPNPYLLADVEIYAKAAEWITRHNEFYTPNHAKWTLTALDTGLKRAEALAKGESPWDQSPGVWVRGYVSEIDGSVQPYAVTLPKGFAGHEVDRWPMHVHLHGRNDKLNEISFIHEHDGKPAPEQTWIQIDVFGRTNNGYRWAGEADVFEAMLAAKRRFRVDNRRIVLRGFSMGGAGAWHLGLHHPSNWCAVGPGAGFVDTVKYMGMKEPLPAWQQKTLTIYDALDYVENAFDVPVCTYGGEEDKQLVASTSMVEAAEKIGVPMKLVIGKGVGHKFTPEGFGEYLAFLNAAMDKGRKSFPGLTEMRFVTYTLKYNTCDWLTIEEMVEPYKPATVEAKIDDKGVLRLRTKNVAMLQVSRDVAYDIDIDGTTLPLTTAAQGLLPGVYYDLGNEKWGVIGYDSSLGFAKNLDMRKRHNLQGPIDDAFTRPFVCVRGTGKAWSAAQAEWADWNLKRFAAEYDKWFRAKLPIIDDTEVTDELLTKKHLILFGDPGSNSVLAKIHDRLPVKWTEKAITVDGKDYDPATHGLSLVYPNPIAPSHYIVVNSGHTFHEKDFRGSNAMLYPRLGDIAVQKFEKSDDGYQESTVWGEIFNSSWFLPGAVPGGRPAESKDE